MARKELGHVPDAELEADDRACAEDVRVISLAYRQAVRHGWGALGRRCVMRLLGYAKMRAVIASERARRRMAALEREGDG